MEPERQAEIQLSHLCNNRCVFCVSGQRSEAHEARPVPAAMLLERIRAQRAAGATRLTLMGGEPTLHPEFLELLRGCVALGFEEIVLFTNGARTANPEFVDAILATGGAYTFRFSFQGANAEAHERTTRRRGSFARLVRSLENVQARGARATVNMCVVRTNYESVAEFPALLLPRGVRQLHLDMMRPLDAGVRTPDELRALMPRYSELAPHLERMIAGFPPGFDVNIGNFPPCIAPRLAPWIHHDGLFTLTVAIDSQDSVSQPWNKYEVKRRDKLKPATCAACALEPRCSGVFETYRELYGLGELVPVTAAQVAQLDPDGKLGLAPAPPPADRRLQPWLDRLAGRSFGGLGWLGLDVAAGGREATLRYRDPAGARADVTLSVRDGRLQAAYRLGDPAAPASPALREGLRALFQVLRGA